MKRQSTSAGKVVILESGDPISAETEEIQNRIRERAFEISQSRGHAGREMEDWLAAESDVISVPPMDMIERDGGFQVRMAAPGVSLADVNVMATREQMLVKCPTRHSHTEDSGVLHICDFKSGTLFRAFRFPEAIDVKSLQIDFEDGLLRITAAKAGAPAAKPGPAPRKRPAARKATITKGKRGAA